MQLSVKSRQTFKVGELHLSNQPTLLSRRSEAAFVMSLFEVVIAFTIVAIMFGIIINGYVEAARRSQWTGYSLAAQSLGIQTVEQLRSAVWDPGQPGKQIDATNINLLNKTFFPNQAAWTNFTGYKTNILDVPWKGTNYVVTTNWVTVQMVKLSYNTNIMLQMVRVDTIWPFNQWKNHSLKYYTNTICTFIAPDNRDPSTL